MPYDRHVNIPIEVLRTVAAIAECGSYTRAAEKLGISQPGISAQIKKLQVLVGGPIFERTSHGIVLTEKGKLLLPLTKQLLESNDQILRLGGTSAQARQARVGLSDLYAERFLTALPRDQNRDLQIHCGTTEDIVKGLDDGYLDVGCLFGLPPELGNLDVSWEETLVWVRSRDFVISTGSPIPVIGGLGLPQDRISLAALQSEKIPYRVVVQSADHGVRLAAVTSGLGVMAVPHRAINENVVIAREYYLPELPKVNAGIFVRPGMDALRGRALQRLLSSIVKPLPVELATAT